jgi:hypothetical protein
MTAKITIGGGYEPIGREVGANETTDIVIHSPAGPTVENRRIRRPRFEGSWQTARIALIDNSKHGAVPLLEGLADGLRIPEGRRTVVNKLVATKPLTDAELGEVGENADLAIVAVGNCGSCCSWACHDAVTIAAKLGIPSVVVITTPFANIAAQIARSMDYPDLPTVVVEHPVGDIPYEIVYQRAFEKAGWVRSELETAAAAPGEADAPAAAIETFAIGRDQEDVDQFFLGRNWSDGLPIVAPTAERVSAMLGRHLARADEIVGRVPTGLGAASLRAIAVNAVMAGCRPEYFDVLVAAVKAVCAPEFNLHAIQATTHPVGPMIMVNGPIAERIGMNSGTNVFGQGNRANATIGRALRLVLITIGQGVPGHTDRATMGQPGKYSFCFAENEAESPWEPYHVSRGFAASDSVVSVFGSEGPMNMNDLASDTELLKTFIACMLQPGSNHHQFPTTEPFLAISPEHAARLARIGFTRRSLQEYLYEHAEQPVSVHSAQKIEKLMARCRPQWFGPENTTGVAKLADRPDDYRIAIVGGPGTHSMFIPSFGDTVSVSVKVAE